MKPRAGFSMLEVLIAILVFSFGLMGLAGLQLVGLAANQSATQRTLATSLAYDMADRIRGNVVGGRANDYDKPAATNNKCQSAHFADVPSTVATCSPLQLAQDDVFDWNKALAALLPSGSGVVCIDSTPDDGAPGDTACDGSGKAYAIKVWWTDKPKDGPAVVRRIAIGLQP